MKSQELKPEIFVANREEISISSTSFIQLVKSIFDKNIPVRFQAKGPSMFPFIRGGDVITVFPLSCSPLHIGDVVAFVHPHSKKLIVHRLVGKCRNLYLMRGDNNPDTDGLVPEASILGRVSRVERKGKKVSIGAGIERYFIAFVSRMGLRLAIFYPLCRIFLTIIRRFRIG